MRTLKAVIFIAVAFAALSSAKSEPRNAPLNIVPDSVPNASDLPVPDRPIPNARVGANETNLRTSKDLYEQCNRGVNYGRGGHAAVFGPRGFAAALYSPDGLYGITEDKVCIAFMMETYQWALRSPAKVGRLVSPKEAKQKTGVPTDPNGLGMYLGGQYVAGVLFKDWFQRCPDAISARDAAIALIQQDLAYDSPSGVIPQYRVIPPGSPRFPSPPIKIETIPWGPGCETANTSLAAMKDRGAACRASIARRNELVAAQARQIAEESRSQCLPSRESSP